jgi:YVTN family beta-propeller protein
MRLLLLILTLATGVLTPVFGQYWEGVIDIGTPQAQVLANPLSNKIYTSNYEANTVTIIDGATRQIIATKSVSGTPWYLCLNTVSNRVYCLPPFSSRLAIINGVTDSLKRLTIPHGGPNTMAYSATLNRLYLGCDDGYVVVVDGAGDTVLSEFHVGPEFLYSAYWNPATNYLFCSTLDSALVIDCMTGEVKARRNMGYFNATCHSPVSGRVCAGGPYGLWVFSPRGDSVLASFIRSPAALCAVPFPDKMYIDESCVYVLDCRTNTILGTIPCGGSTTGQSIVCDMSRGKAYVSDPGQRQVAVVDARADTVLETIPLPAFDPQALCLNPLDGRVYVTDHTGDSVYVLRDTMPGIEESPKPQAASYKPVATVVHGVLLLGAVGSTQNTGHRTELLDISGRKVLDLKPGANDVSDLAPGVYFVITSSPSSSPPEGERVGVRGREASSVRKVVIAR